MPHLLSRIWKGNTKYFSTLGGFGCFFFLGVPYLSLLLEIPHKKKHPRKTNGWNLKRNHWSEISIHRKKKTSWWFQPLWKILISQNGFIFPNFRDENSKKYLSCHHPENMDSQGDMYGYRSLQPSPTGLIPTWAPTEGSAFRKDCDCLCCAGTSWEWIGLNW